LLIEQVLLNLLENAMHHARNMTQLSLHVTALKKQIVFEVIDNGCGIEINKMNDLFTGIFEPKDGQADTKRRNSGIGLSVCATIIKAHGGTISAENRSSGGALFRFILEKEEDNDGQQT
jgi:two-component system sensor histidine kinase KdpD